MTQQRLSINGIPAILWGPASKSLFLAVHGDQSHKADEVIAIFAAEATQKGHQTLSFDLPEHGERKGEPRLCKVQNCVEDLQVVMHYARSTAQQVGLFGCSLGAYFSMLAYMDEPIRQALFLSPVVDMARVIRNIMLWTDVSEERLQQELTVTTPIKTLYWDYYQYVLAHPVQWTKPTKILYGSNDNLSEADYIKAFTQQTRAELTILKNGEHFFHTREQLDFYRQWLGKNLQEPACEGATQKNA